MSATRHIQNSRIVTFTTEANTFFETIYIADDKLCLFFIGRNIIDTNLLLIESSFMFHSSQVWKCYTFAFLRCIESLVDNLNGITVFLSTKFLDLIVCDTVTLACLLYQRVICGKEIC